MPPPHLAVIGGGQLARMMQTAAVGLGVRLRLLAESADASAAQVIPDSVVGDHTSLGDLQEVCADAPVVTFDHEHVPTDHLVTLTSDGHVCRPGPDALVHAQDKAVMRERLMALGVPCPRHARISSTAELEAFGFPAVIKTTRGGYDGKGVWIVRAMSDADDAFASGAELLAEELVDFTRELAVLVARSPSGEMMPYPVVESRQVDGVCTVVIAPAPDLADSTAADAVSIATTIAAELDVTGILAVELFETADGRVLVNELAMRPHNTGHWSIDGAATSQFENHLRAVLDLPLGPTTTHHAWTVMVNIIGGSVTDLEVQRAGAWDAEPGAKVHLYGKSVQPGRKVGHVTTSGDDLDEVLASAQRAALWFTDGAP